MAGVDSLWTSLWVDGHAGPVTDRLTSRLRQWGRRLIGPGNNRLLSLIGPVVFLTTVFTWVLLLWAGWVLVFSADPTAIRESHTHVTASLIDRIYYVGGSLFTLGAGDFSPDGRGWELATALTALSGFFLVTLAVTYLLSVIQSVVSKRAFATQATSLGGTPEEFVLTAWDGAGFPALPALLVTLAGQLGKVSEEHQAYPILHFYHASTGRKAPAVAIAVLDEALTLLAHGVAPDRRPPAVALRTARAAVGDYLQTLAAAYVTAADDVPPAPSLALLRSAGIPTVSDAEFQGSLASLEGRRRLLLGMVRAEAWPWPPAQESATPASPAAPPERGRGGQRRD